MIISRQSLFILALLPAILGAPAMAAVSPGDVALDATRIQPFAIQMLKYEHTEKIGELPGPWVPGAWADGAVGRVELVADASDGKPAIRMTNVSGRPSLMLKPWTEVTLDRGVWEARLDYRKVGTSSGRLELQGPDGQKSGIELSPSGDAFRSVALPIEVSGNEAEHRLGLQLYGGLGADEALFIRSFRLERTGDLALTDEEARAAAERAAEAEAVAKREAARRAAERQPIGDWVRPEVEPTPMTEPLEPPPVTGKTCYVATSGADQAGDGSKEKPWRTIQHGMNQLHPGDRLYIRGGEYRENMLTFARSGGPDAYITVAGYPDEQVKVINSGGMAVFNLDAGSPWTPKRLHEEAYLVIRDLYVDAVDGNQAFRINGPMMLEGYRDDVVKSRGLRHNIWIVNNEIVGGGPAEGGLGGGYGAHDLVFSNNRIHDTTGGLMAFLFCDGTIIEWNTVTHTSRDQDDAGAIKSMAPGVIIRYNTVYDNQRSPTSTKAGWAPASEGGEQWRFLQGVTGIYLDWARVSEKNNAYPEALIPEDPANHVYGNTVRGNNAGIFVFLSDHAQIFDNVVHGNGRDITGGWIDGKEGGTWLEFVGPAGHGIRVSGSKNVKVFDNIVYDHRKAGLAVDGAKNGEFYGNVLFGNDLAQIHIEKGEETAVGFNMIVDTGTQGPPFRRIGKDFASVAAFQQQYPYQDEGTRIIPLPKGTTAVELANRLLEEQPVDQAAWQAARQRLRARALEAGVGKPVGIVDQAPFDPTRSLQAPLPKALPATIEFESYDVGGPGISFHDADSGNQGGHYRLDAVDIKPSEQASNGALVGFTKDGEWMEYTVSVAQAGEYRLAVTYATPEQDRRISLTLAGTPLGRAIIFQSTTNWDDLQTMDAGRVTLPAGDAVLRVTIESGPVDLDCLRIGSGK